MIPQFKPLKLSHWGSIWARGIGLIIREEDSLECNILRESMENTGLTEEERSDIENLLRSLHDIPRWRFGVLPGSFDNRMGDTVIVSEERKSYLDLYVERRLLPEREEDRDKDIVKEIQAVRVLGEYKSGEIILYINNIKDTAAEENAPGFYGIPYLTVLRYVYLHELMHAYFDRGDREGYKHVRETEEGLAEFGALLLLGELVGRNPGEGDRDVLNHAGQAELDWALGHVAGKKGQLACYARGAELFRQYSHDRDLSRKILEAYPGPVEQIKD